jgi:hypothetical protein
MSATMPFFGPGGGKEGGLMLRRQDSFRRLTAFEENVDSSSVYDR